MSTTDVRYAPNRTIGMKILAPTNLLAFAVVYALPACQSPCIVAEHEFLQLHQEQTERTTRSALGRCLSPTTVRRLLALLDEKDLDPVYRGYLWTLAEHALQQGSVGMDAWFRGYEQLVGSVAQRYGRTGELQASRELWRELQRQTGLRLAVDPLAFSLYDGTAPTLALDIADAPGPVFLDWVFSVAHMQTGCIIGFGSIYITFRHGTDAHRFPREYQTYERAHRLWQSGEHGRGAGREAWRQPGGAS
jgi:hypothetical protein